MSRFDTSWFPLKNFTRKGCHRDWMVGPTKFPKVRDELNPERTVGKYETVFWNRTLNAAVSLESYRKAVLERDLEKMDILERLGIPDDIAI